MDVTNDILSVLYLMVRGWWVFLAAVIIYLLFNRYHNQLRYVPGPFLASCTKLPRILTVTGGQPHVSDLAMHRKYGKVVRLAPNLVSVADPAAIDQIYGVSTRFYKSSFYKPIRAYDDEGLIPDTLVLTDKTLHSRMKRNAANAYSMNFLVQMEPLVNEVTDNLYLLIDKSYASPADAVFSLTFGKNLDFLNRGDHVDLLSTMEFAVAYIAVVGLIPWTHNLLLGNPLLLRLLGDELAWEKSLNRLAKEQVAKYKEKSTEDDEAATKLTFLQRLLHNQRVKPESINDREINTHALGNITAGADTTATALRAIFYHTLKNPRIYQKLCHEIREEAGLTHPVSFTTASTLPYLNAVISEGMRIHPSISAILPRSVPEGGAKIGDHYLPAGTEVGISPWVVHHDPSIFPDPDSFQPERWLTQDASHLQRMKKSIFTFGGGAHTCSGKHISLMEITKLVPSFLLRYDLDLVNPAAEWKFTSRWLAAQTGINVRIRRRDIESF